LAHTVLRLAKAVFYFIEHLPFDEINLRCEVRSDIGNFNILLTHKLVLCEEFKQENNKQNETANDNNQNETANDSNQSETANDNNQNETANDNNQNDYYTMCVKRNKYKIDVTKPIKIVCKLP
jgi:hypothetical protein